jgi:hypothetical protein
MRKTRVKTDDEIIDAALPGTRYACGARMFPSTLGETGEVLASDEGHDDEVCN